MPARHSSKDDFFSWFPPIHLTIYLRFFFFFFLQINLLRHLWLTIPLIKISVFWLQIPLSCSCSTYPGLLLISSWSLLLKLLFTWSCSPLTINLVWPSPAKLIIAPWSPAQREPTFCNTSLTPTALCHSPCHPEPSRFLSHLLSLQLFCWLNASKNTVLNHWFSCSFSRNLRICLKWKIRWIAIWLL